MAVIYDLSTHAVSAIKHKNLKFSPFYNPTFYKKEYTNLEHEDHILSSLWFYYFADVVTHLQHSLL